MVPNSKKLQSIQGVAGGVSQFLDPIMMPVTGISVVLIVSSCVYQSPNYFNFSF